MQGAGAPSAVPVSWQAVSGIVGILGFVLSVLLWVVEVRRRRVNLVISNMFHSCLVTASNARLYLDFMISNRSSNPVSITSAEVIGDENSRIPAETDRTQMLYQRRKSGDVITAYANIATCKFPVSLQPSESASILLCIRLDSKLLQSLRLPQVDTPEAFVAKRRGVKPDGINDAPWTRDLVLYTSWKPKRFRVTAKYRHISHYQELASNALDFAENQR